MHVVEQRRGSIGVRVVGRSGAHEVDRGAALRYKVCQLVVPGGHVHHARVGDGRPDRADPALLRGRPRGQQPHQVAARGAAEQRAPPSVQSVLGAPIVQPAEQVQHIPAGGRKASRTAQINGLLLEITGDHG